MDNRAVVERIMKYLAFEVEAVPDNKTYYSTTTFSKTDLLNVKIQARKKEMNGPLSEPEVVPQRVRLINSAGTITSFDMFIEMESEKKHPKKPRKHIFNKLKPGLCFGVTEDDDQPYVPDIVSTSIARDAPVTTSDGILREPFRLTKHTYGTFFSTVPKKEKTFLGKKYKPGGCLDPPFSEDKYSYEPSSQEPLIPNNTTLKIDNTNIHTKLEVKNADRNKRKSKDLPVNIKTIDDKQEKSSSILSLYTVESKRDSVITYPPQDIIDVPKTKAPSEARSSAAKFIRPSSIDKSRLSINEPTTTFFSPPKGVKRDSNNYVQYEPPIADLYNPKSPKTSVPIASFLNSIPVEKRPINIEDNNAKTVDSQRPEIQSEPDVVVYEQLDSIPLIIPIPVDEKVTPNSFSPTYIKICSERLINDTNNTHSNEKISFERDYESSIIPIQVHEEVFDKVIVDSIKLSVESRNSKNYSKEIKAPESISEIIHNDRKSVSKPVTEVPQLVYEAAKNITPEILKPITEANPKTTEEHHVINSLGDPQPHIEKEPIQSNKLSNNTGNFMMQTQDTISDTILEKVRDKVSSNIHLENYSKEIKTHASISEIICNDRKSVTKQITEHPQAVYEAAENITPEILKSLTEANSKTAEEKHSINSTDDIQPNLEMAPIQSNKLSDNIGNIIMQPPDTISDTILAKNRDETGHINLEIDSQNIVLETSLIKKQNASSPKIENDIDGLDDKSTDTNYSKQTILSEITNALDVSNKNSNLANKLANAEMYNLTKDNNNSESGNSRRINSVEIKSSKELQIDIDYTGKPNIKSKDEVDKPNISSELPNIKTEIPNTISELPNIILEGAKYYTPLSITQELSNKSLEVSKDDQNFQSIHKDYFANDKLPNQDINRLKLNDADNASKQNQSKFIDEDIKPKEKLMVELDSDKEITAPTNKSATSKAPTRISSLLESKADTDKPSNEKSYPLSNTKSTNDLRTVFLNLGFHSYLNNKNEIVVKTVFTENDSSRYPKDSLTVVRSKIQLYPGDNYPELNIPIDSKFDLAIKIKKNNDRNVVAPDESKTKREPDFSEPATTLNTKCERNISEQKAHNQINEYDKLLHSTLTDIYERDLIPLQKMIRDLKGDIDELTGEQKVFKKKVCGPKKNKPPRLTICNKKCGPCRL